MSTAIDDRAKVLPAKTIQPRRVRKDPNTSSLEPQSQARADLAARIERNRESSKLDLIQLVLLGGAVCIAMTGLVNRLQTPAAASPDAPAPVVLVQTD